MNLVSNNGQISLDSLDSQILGISTLASTFSSDGQGFFPGHGGYPGSGQMLNVVLVQIAENDTQRHETIPTSGG